MSKTRQERPHVQMHYTVTPIGGKADLDKWKVERKQIEDEWQASVIKTRQERRLAAMEYVASQAEGSSQKKRRQRYTAQL